MIGDDSFSEIDFNELRRINAAVTAFEESLERGESASIEQTLSSYPGSLKRPLFRELLHSEVDRSCRSGQNPDVSTYRERFPDYADLIETVFAESPQIDAAEQRTADFAGTSDPTPPVANESSFDTQRFPFRMNDYEVIEKVGQGGMGAVYRAHDPKLNRTVAIKVLLPQLASDSKARARFLREARTAAAIRHPSVVTVHAINEDHNPPFLVLEFVDGQSLAALIRDGKQLEPQGIRDIGRDLATGLVAAHGEGILHRDIKPGNILIETRDGRARLADFGLASVHSEQGSVTATGEVLGTPQYMSPEQIEGHDLDERSDLFSVGVVLYRLVTGQLPFSGKSAATVARKICDQDPVPIVDIKPETPQWLQLLISQLLRKDPADRIASADELLNCLTAETCDPRKPIRILNQKRMVAMVIAVASTVTCAAFLFPDTQIPDKAESPITVPPAEQRLAHDSILPRPVSDLVEQATSHSSPGPAPQLPLFVNSGYRLGTSASHTAEIADMDNDGDLDIIVGNGKFSIPQSNQLWINDGDGKFTLGSEKFDNRITGDIALGDVNRDGLVDVYFSNWSDTAPEWSINSLWLNEGSGRFTESSQARDPGNSRGVYMADIDVDGDLDIWISNFNESDTLWINDGSGRFAKTDLNTPGTKGGIAVLQDINSDGLPDAVIQRSSFELWLNHGNSQFRKVEVLYDGRIVCFDLRDLNNDGLVDIAAQRTAGIQIWMNAGGLKFNQQELFGNEGRYNPLAIGDLNMDGTPDILSANIEQDGATVYLNNGNGEFHAVQTGIPVKFTSQVRLGDLDNDGDLDAFFANSDNNNTSEPDQVWWNTTIHQSRP